MPIQPWASRAVGTPAHHQAFECQSKPCSFITQAEHESHNWTTKPSALLAAAFVSGGICITSTPCVPSPALPSWGAASASARWGCRHLAAQPRPGAADSPLSALEAGRPGSRHWQRWFLARPLFLACVWLPSCCVLSSLRSGGQGGGLLGLFLFLTDLGPTL